MISAMGVGAALILLGALLEGEVGENVGVLETIGVLIMGSLHFSLAVIQTLIVLEYFTKKQYPMIWALALMGLTLGRMLAYPIHSLPRT